ncbi:membrane protein [Bacillus coahuilensis p1.1.43]|uniref:Membrane protein n=1 Tax=Bacillus coahuilensis p1.1.43 TaxID=1150625 RepID=A0A147K5J4_9BACI|nr:YqaA family protein [Bacillus coahuilensis]KUP04904.1 membrane protein [Bacillus coahuilensis p1.1.43]
MSELIHLVEEWLLEYGVWGLIVVSFAESSFFPIPPDFILIPLSLANPDRAFLYAAFTTLASALGAFLGWYIGKKLGRPVLRYFISEERIEKVENLFSKYGPLAILIAGFTPIPYKVFTVFAGVSNLSLGVLFLWSLIGRGIRFFLEAALIVFLGAEAEAFISENFTVVTLVVAIVLIVVWGIYKFVQKKQHTA